MRIGKGNPAPVPLSVTTLPPVTVGSQLETISVERFTYFTDGCDFDITATHSISPMRVL
jgi:hypothetical protein